MSPSEHLDEAARVLGKAEVCARLYRAESKSTHFFKAQALEWTGKAWSSIFRALVSALASITASLDAQDRVMQRAAVQDRADLLAARIWNIETALGLWKKAGAK